MPKHKPAVAHYDHARIQPIDFYEGSFTESEYRGFLKGNAIKYISRAWMKGDPVSDLNKAMDYIKWLLELADHEKIKIENPVVKEVPWSRL